MNTPRLTVRWMMSSCRRNHSGLGPQVAQQMVGPQEGHGARDAEECEVIDEGRQQEGDDDDKIRQTDDAERLPAPILVCRQAGGEFERSRPARTRSAGTVHHWSRTIAASRKKATVRTSNEAVAETAGAHALAEIELSQMGPHASSRQFHVMRPARECRCASAPASWPRPPSSPAAARCEPLECGLEGASSRFLVALHSRWILDAPPVKLDRVRCHSGFIIVA